ncbi:hypothetical protein BJV77DRAFT_961073 [Russula vinacea]|nr:hypothetical protein BJV77DRAFT_961073 [Russula vinacea]
MQRKANRAFSIFFFALSTTKSVPFRSCAPQGPFWFSPNMMATGDEPRLEPRKEERSSKENRYWYGAVHDISWVADLFKIEFYQKAEKTEGTNSSLLSFGNVDSINTFPRMTKI